MTFEQNLALIREYCAKQFVDKGMVCDLYYHDSGNGNPHVHLMLTMCAMDENGRWLPKTKTAYVLDENGDRVRGDNGKWLRERMDTVDWNDQKYAEIWRHEWEMARTMHWKLLAVLSVLTCDLTSVKASPIWNHRFILDRKQLH